MCRAHYNNKNITEKKNYIHIYKLLLSWYSGPVAELNCTHFPSFILGPNPRDIPVTNPHGAEQVAEILHKLSDQQMPKLLYTHMPDHRLSGDTL